MRMAITGLAKCGRNPVHGAMQFFDKSILLPLQFVHHLLQQLDLRRFVCSNQLCSNFLCPSNFLQPRESTFALFQLLHELLACGIVGLETLPCPLDERFYLTQHCIDGTFLSCSSGLLKTLSRLALLDRPLCPLLRELQQPPRDPPPSSSQPQS